MRRVAPALLGAAAALALSAPAASAEVVQKGPLRVSVAGQLAPTTLPRAGSSPVAVSVSGHIASTKPGLLPQLRRIEIAINSHGHLATAGIPLCRLGHIQPSTTAEAKAACGPALVGEGSFSANVRLPEQSPFPSRGKVLAFNGRLRGRPALFAQIYGAQPTPTSQVLPFLIKRTKGTYGTVLEASLPQVTGEWGYVTGLSLELDRTFLSGGRPRSYLSAGCPAPAGFPSVVFPLLRTAFEFDGGTSLATTLQRSCKVKG